jgi:hypothetical protein
LLELPSSNPKLRKPFSDPACSTKLGTPLALSTAGDMTMKPRWILALFLMYSFFSTGCAPDTSESSRTQGWSAFPVPIYSDSSLSASSAAQTDFKDAMGFWESKAGRKLFDYRGQWTGQNPPYTGSALSPETILGNVVLLQNPWPFAQNIAAQTTTKKIENNIDSSVIMVNPNTPFCSSDCLFQTGTSLRRAFAHELGHFLGLDHSDDKTNIMYPTIQTGASLSDLQVDAGALSLVTQEPGAIPL